MHYNFYLVFNIQKLAHCLALLPKSKGDEEGWSLMIQKILLSINRHLTDVFQGFEEGTLRYNMDFCTCAGLEVNYRYAYLLGLQKLNVMKVLGFWFLLGKIPLPP